MLLLGRVFYFSVQPDDVLITVIPDDAFYYIKLAQHRAFDGIWAFDGVRPTTGFHHLHANFLALIYSLYDEVSWRWLFVGVSVASSLTLCLAAWLVIGSARAVLGQSSWLAAIPFFSPIVIEQSTALMESPWVILLSAAAVSVWGRVHSKCNVFHLITLLGIGLAGSMARTDFGMLAGFLWASSVGVYVYRQSKYALYASSALLLGCVLGLILGMWLNFQISGDMLQASAKMKLHWSSLQGHSVGPALGVALNMIVPQYDSLPKLMRAWLRIAFVLGLIWVVWVCLFRNGRKGRGGVVGLEAGAKALVVAMGLTVLAYVIFYRFNSQAVQRWYCASFVVPLSIVVAAVFSLMPQGGRRRSVLISWACILLMGCAQIFSGIYINAVGMLHAARWLGAQPAGPTYAAWNAGILSFFSGRAVVNIDGLVNDGAVPAIMVGNLYDYILVNQVNYIIDYEMMFSDARLKRRGGYAEEAFEQCVAMKHLFPNMVPDLNGYQMRVMSLSPLCK